MTLAALRGAAGSLARLPSVMPPALSSCSMNRRTMTSQRQADHLERTASTFRQEVISPARVCGVTAESETVKSLRLAISNRDFTFKAGQWVDLFIPGVPKVGGFSICSSPGMLKREGVLELAVQYSIHPPAHWVHTQCTLGSEVALRVGGDFFFDPQPCDPPVNLLLLAGGVGINPLLSMLLHVVDLHETCKTKGDGFQMGAVTLYYSAKTTSDLLFKKKILDLMRRFPGKISCNFHVTQQRSQVCPELKPYMTEGRISEKDLAKSVHDANTLCYICGPPPMIEAVCSQLENLHVPTERIRVEKWW